MQWYLILVFVIFIVFFGGAEGIFTFSFCAVISFIFAQNLLNGKDGLDFSSYFVSKGLGAAKGTTKDLSIRKKPFPRGLITCRRILIRNILRDFVLSWYENVGIGGDFILETRALLETATVTFYDSIACTSVSSHTEKLCILLHRHLETTQAAKEKSEEGQNFVEVYRSLQDRTRAFQTSELQYLRNVIDLLLYRLVASKTLGCDAGRFILREILAYKLLLPLLDTISDPDFVNTSIINIFHENKDEKPLIDSLEFNKATDSNLKASTPLMEYLDENSESNTGDICSGKALPLQQTKYKFNDATVIEKDHLGIVELSIETQDFENTLNSFGEEEHSTSETDLKTTPRFCKTGRKTKERSHSFGINGLSKLKPDQKEHSRLKTILSAKHIIPPSGMILSRNFRRIHSSPVIEPRASKNLSEPQETVSSEGGKEILPEETNEDLFESDLERHDFKCNTKSLPKTISHPRQSESALSSYEEVDPFESLKPEVTDVTQSVQKDVAIEQKGLENSSKNEKLTLCQTSSSPGRQRKFTTSVSSMDDWDSETFEHGSLFDAEDDFLETDGKEVSLRGEKASDDNISSANFAILDIRANPCSMISIPKTELVTDHSFEPYKTRYTVYVIVYNTQLWSHCDEHSEKTTSETDSQNVIKRRYREFMELHHRLVVGSYSSSMKDIPKPNRKFNSPFFRLDQEVIEGRQHLLENYLKCLVNQPDILNCDDFKGFLGIGDESHTDFRRHLPNVPLPNMPRIDKKLQKQVTKFIDHIKTAFDSTGPIEGDKEEDYDDIRQVLGEDKSQDEIRTFAICSQGCKLNHSWCFSENAYASFVQRHREEIQTTDFPAQEARSISRVKSQNTHTVNGHASKDLQPGEQFATPLNVSKDPSKQSLNNKDVLPSSQMQSRDENNPLTKTVLNLSCKLLQQHQSWVCLEPVQEAATAVFGSFLEWWMESLLSELVTEEQWQYYLTLLTETVWPGGELMKSTQLEKTEEDKLNTKEIAVQTLTDFFGAVFHATIGREEIEYSAREIIESLQNAEINRQLLLEALEVILAEVFPGLAEEKEFYISSRNC